MSKNSKKPTHPSASDVSVPRHVFTPPTCPICSDVITFKTAVNPLCGHTHCQTCFWKWARKSNSCPFCRQDLIARDREKELEVESLIERRHEMRENLEEMFNEGAARALYLHELQDNIILEEAEKKATQEAIKENRKIMKNHCQLMHENAALFKKVNDWGPRIRLWECHPEKALKLWRVEAQRMKHEWRVEKMKRMRVCLHELTELIKEKTDTSHLPNCIKYLMNQVPHIEHATHIKKTPKMEEENLDLNTLYDTEDKETEAEETEAEETEAEETEAELTLSEIIEFITQNSPQWHGYISESELLQGIPIPTNPSGGGGGRVTRSGGGGGGGPAHQVPRPPPSPRTPPSPRSIQTPWDIPDIDPINRVLVNQLSLLSPTARDL